LNFLEEFSDEWTSFVTKDSNSTENLNGSSSEPSLSEHDHIQHSLSKCSLLSDEPLVEVEEESHSQENGDGYTGAQEATP